MTIAIESPFRPRPMASAPPGAPRLHADGFPPALYAIGDVHGRLDLLEGLEDAILEHAGLDGPDVWMVLLGDLVDRGPASAQVIDHVMTPHPSGFGRICLLGNHDAAMIEAINDPKTFAWWCRYGGLDTLASYGIDTGAIDPGGGDWTRTKPILDAHIPEHHLEFIAGLPAMLCLPGHVLVHAGLQPGVALDAQTETDLLWCREPIPVGGHPGGRVVHGHTIVRRPVVDAHRVALDTGAFRSGVLTAARLRPDAEPQIIAYR